MRSLAANGWICAQLLEHVPAAVALFDADMRCLACSRRWLADHGLGDQDIIGQSFHDTFPEADPRWRAIHGRALAGETLSGAEAPLARACAPMDGLTWEITPWRDDAGKIGGVALFTRPADAAEQATAASEQARAVAASDAQLRSILDTVPDAMITIAENGAILSFSTTAERLFGYCAAEVIGRNVAMLMPEPEASRHDGYLARHRATGEQRIIGNMRRVMGLRKDGSQFPHELYIGQVNGDGWRIYIGFLRDLTAREEAQARLRDLHAELIHISRVSAVGTMAGALAHELNQPLTAIANYVQTSAQLLETGQEQALDMVRTGLSEAGREALRAGAIIRRLREFVARGELDRTVASPRDLALQARELGCLGGAARGITCDIAIPADLPGVLVDRVQVQQVLLNLIRNAFEALGDSGTVVIAARREGRMIRFSVMDDGPGVAPGKEDDVFEPFVSSKASGMGIGLAICRTIAQWHGGAMWCEPGHPGGAAFHFTVPVAESYDD